MISQIAIHNFKAIEDLELNDLRRIVLVSGRNNVGKSTLLEALFLYMDHAASQSFLNLNAFRGVVGRTAETVWTPVFHKMDISKRIQISIKDSQETGMLVYSTDKDYLPSNISGMSDLMIGKFRYVTRSSYALSFSFEQGDYRENGHFSLNGDSVLTDAKTSLLGNEVLKMKPTQFIGGRYPFVLENLVNGFGHLELEGRKEVFLDVLRTLDPRIQDVITASPNGVAQLYARMGGETIPLNYVGDGVLRLANICLAIMQFKGGLVLIDELETGFHYSMYKKLWEMIDSISMKSGCQVVATTHSYELIRSACLGIKHPEDFAYYRLGLKQDRAVAHRFDFSMLEKAVDSELEIR